MVVSRRLGLMVSRMLGLMVNRMLGLMVSRILGLSKYSSIIITSCKLIGYRLIGDIRAKELKDNGVVL